MAPRSFKTAKEVLDWLMEEGLVQQGPGAEAPSEPARQAPDQEEDDPRRYEAQWERSLAAPVYAPERIPPRKTPIVRRKEETPPLLREARKLAIGRRADYWRVRVFVEQGELLADYTDEYENLTDVVCYFPTYEKLSNRELRSYFAWRTKVRQGVWEETSLSFAFLYAYELINQIGVADPMDGYRKLVALRDNYGKINPDIVPYLETWLFSYIPYYGLDASLLADTPQVRLDSAAYVLEQAPQHTATEIMDAIKLLAPQWLNRSAYYRDHRADMELVLVGVLRGMQAHYTNGKSRGLVANLYGKPHRYTKLPFVEESAVFLRKDRSNKVYQIDPLCKYDFYQGCVVIQKFDYSSQKATKLTNLTKAVDAALREATGYGHSIQVPAQKQWVDKLIRQEVNALLDRKAAEAKAAEEEARRAALPSLNLGSLEKIRRDADITRDRLMVDEEAPEAEAPAPAEPSPAISPAPPEEPAAEDSLPLTAQERRFLKCLLYGGSLGWLHEAGILPSVLADSVNEKLYDEFMDVVVGDDLTVVDDYAQELKGRIPQ